MIPISIGKLRGLQQCASPRGTLTCLALDHRQNLRRALNPADPSAVDDARLSEFKLAVTAALAPYATAILLDPEVSAAQAVASGVLPGDRGLVVALESTGYLGEPSARLGQVLPGWSVQKARRMGASLAKLLVYYHPASSSAADIEEFVAGVAADCAREDLGLMLETLSYPLVPGTRLTSSEKRVVVVETSRRLALPGVDLLKVEFPLDPQETPAEDEWMRACAELSAVCPVPWILLSAAVDYPTFLRQVAVACQAGASGIAVGRAVWQEAVSLRGAERDSFLRVSARDRLERLTSLCSALARPIYEFYSAEAPFDWYRH